MPLKMNQEDGEVWEIQLFICVIDTHVESQVHHPPGHACHGKKYYAANLLIPCIDLYWIIQTFAQPHFGLLFPLGLVQTKLCYV